MINRQYTEHAAQLTTALTAPPTTQQRPTIMAQPPTTCQQLAITDASTADSSAGWPEEQTKLKQLRDTYNRIY